MDKESDTWCTPDWILDDINTVWGNIYFDAACTKENCVVPNQIIFYPEYDLSSLSWHKEDGVIFCNPPYSNPTPFIHKAVQEYKEERIKSIFLVRADLTTKWMKYAYFVGGASIYFIGRRIKFKGADNCYNFPSAFLAFDGNISVMDYWDD